VGLYYMTVIIGPTDSICENDWLTCVLKFTISYIKQESTLYLYVGCYTMYTTNFGNMF
jgi:hypothetical protein